MSIAHPVPGHELVNVDTSTSVLGYPVAIYTCECGKKSQPMGAEHVARGHANHARMAAKAAR